MKPYKLFLTLACYMAFCSLQAQNGKPFLKFVENKGQWDHSILYRCELPKGKLYLQSGSFLFNFYEPSTAHKHGQISDHAQDSAQAAQDIKAHAYRINFTGCSGNTQILSSELQHTKYNFFKSDDPSRWGMQAQSFRKISYKNLYRGIHLDLYEIGGSLKYEYIVEAGANVNNIVMNYEGVEHLYLQNGELHVLTPVSHVIDAKPFAYQYIKGKQVVIPCEFVIRGNDVSFHFPKGYNTKIPLVIDPKLIFSSYSGSTNDNWGNTAAFDKDGHLYSGGIVFDDFPTTQLGPYTFPMNGDIDVLILKYTLDGSDVEYITVLGGRYSEIPTSLVVNNQDQLLILGTTSSGGSGSTLKYPVTSGAYQTIYAGGSFTEPLGAFHGVTYPFGSDLFITKLNTDGTLANSTYVGGSGNEGLLPNNTLLTKNYGDQYRGDILIDEDDNIYVASHTRSIDFPVTAGVVDNTLTAGDMDGVVLKLAPDLSALTWATYIGGTAFDAVYSIQLDSLENIVVAGGTGSFDLPVSPGAYKTTNSGAGDGFVCYLRNDAQEILACTYVGTTSYDQVYFVQLDTTENVYLLGQTRGAYPVSSGVYSNANSGQFIHKLNKELTTTIFSSVFGTGGFQPNIVPTAFLVNDCENIFVAGWGGNVNAEAQYVNGFTTGLYTTPEAFDRTTDGSDFYLVVFPKDMAASPIYATFMGGSLADEHVDGGTSRFDKRGIVYQAVCANCGGINGPGGGGFPVSHNPDAWSTTNNSWNCNNAAFKFDLANLEADFIADTLNGCDATTIRLTNTSIGGSTFSWQLDGVEFSTSSTTTQVTITGPGTYTIWLIATDQTTCIGRDTAEKIITIYPLPAFDVNVLDSIICKGDTIELSTVYDPDFIYEWKPNKWISNTTIHNPEVWPDSTISYYLTVTDENGCEETDTVKIKVAYISLNTSWENLTDCLGIPKASFKNKSYGPLNYLWDFGDGQTSTESTPTHIYENPGSYQVTVDISNDGCEEKDTINIVLEPVKVPNLMTRNGDGLNDLFKIQGMTKDWHVEIYNRWGKPLYSSDNYPNDWAGEDLVDGIYYYLIVTPEGTECKGWVHLMK